MFPGGVGVSGTQTLGPVKHLSMLPPTHFPLLHDRSVPGSSSSCVLPSDWAYFPGCWLSCVALQLLAGADGDLALSASSDHFLSEFPSQPGGARVLWDSGKPSIGWDPGVLRHPKSLSFVII